jgi:hypothetical protein
MAADLAANRREPPRAFLRFTYSGFAYRIENADLTLEEVGGAFGIYKWLPDAATRIAAIIDNGEGQRWLVFDVNHLKEATQV